MAEEYKISVKELTNPLRISAKSCEMTRHTTWAMLMNSAADAIEQLNTNYEQAMKYAGMWEAIANGTKELLLKEHDIVPKWISVTERMPEKHKRVFVCTRWKAVGIDFVNADGDWYTTGGVTHWMPLPEPPKEVGE